MKKSTKRPFCLKKQTEIQIGEIGFQKDRCVDLLIAGTLTKEIYDKKMPELAQKETELKAQLEQRSVIDSEIAEMLESVVDFAGNAGFYFQSSQPAEQRQFLGMLVSNCVMEGEKLRYSLQKPFNLLQEKPNSVIWWR